MMVIILTTVSLVYGVAIYIGTKGLERAERAIDFLRDWEKKQNAKINEHEKRLQSINEEQKRLGNKIWLKQLETQDKNDV